MEGQYVRIQLLWLLVFSGWLSYAQVGINTTTPLSTLDINGNLSVKTVTLVGGNSGSPTQINDGVYISLEPRNGTNLDHFRMPSPSTCPGRIYVIRNITDFDNAQLSIDGGTTRFFPKDARTGTFTLTIPFTGTNKSIIVLSDGLNWTYFN